MSATEEFEYLGSPGQRTLSARQMASRNAVLAAAADAFTTRGYAATSIDDIADRLGATKGRIYHYFRTKGEIFVGIHRRALELSIASIRPCLDGEGSAVERLRAMAGAHANLMMTETSFMRLAVQHAEMSLAGEGRTRQKEIDEIFELRDTYESFFEQVIREGVDAGELTTSEPGLMAKAVLGSLNWMSVWYNPRADGNSARKQEIAEAMATFVVNGLGPRRPARRRAQNR